MSSYGRQATTVFGECRRSLDSGYTRPGGTLVVTRNLDWSIPRPSTATVFPGRNATIPLHRSYGEHPDPVSEYGWSSDARQPLIADGATP